MELLFEDDAIRAIAAKAIDRATGARGLRAIIEEIMTPLMFDIPSRDDVQSVVITKECVTDGAEPKWILKPTAELPQE